MPPHDLISFPVLSSFRDQVRTLSVSFGDEDVAVWCDQHVIWRVATLRRRRATRLAQGHQQIAFRAELEYLHPLGRTGDGAKRCRRTASGWCRHACCATRHCRIWRRAAAPAAASDSPCAACCRTSSRRSGSTAARQSRRVGLVVGDPDVSVFVDEDAVGRHDHAAAEHLDDAAVLVDVQDRIDGRQLAGGRIGNAVSRAAPFGHPDRLAVLVDVDRARRTHHPSCRQLDEARDRLIRIRRAVDRRAAHIARNRRGLRASTWRPACHGTRCLRVSLPSANRRTGHHDCQERELRAT